MSNRLTFSLASLILMFAFVVMPAMAHDTSTDTEGIQHGGDTLTDAEHNAQHMDAPTVESIELVDLMVGGASTVRGTDVTLVVNANTDPLVAVDLTAASGSGEFQIKVTFSEPVYNAIAPGTAAGGGDLVTDDLTATAASQATPGTDLFESGGAKITTIARAADDDATTDVNESLNTFILTVEVTRPIIGDSDDDTVPSRLPVDVWLSVNAGVLFNLTGLVEGTTTFGTGNTASDREMFTIVAALEATSVTADAPTAVGSSTDIEVTLSATDPDTVPSLTVADFVVMEGTTALTPKVEGATLTITPAGTGDTTVTVAPSEAGMAKITFDTVSVTVDRTAPVVTITGPTGDVKADQVATATVEVSGAAADAALELDDISVTQTVADGDSTVLAHTYAAATGAVTFTPTAESTVTVSVDAGAVVDDVGNESAAVSSDITVLAADAPPIGQPTNVKVALNTAEDGYTVSWDEPADTTGIGGYHVSYNPVDFVPVGTTSHPIGSAKPTAVSVWSTRETTAPTTPPTAPPADVTPATADLTGLPDLPAGPADGTFTIPAKSYIVIGHDEGTSGLPASITPMTWAAMPDLENLLHGGGTLLLTHVKADKIDRDNDPATDAVEAKKRDALITEVMAAVNLAEVGQAGYTAHQWIELYNNLDIPLTVSIRAIAGRETATNPLNASATEIRLDRLSNQVGAGWTFEGLGQNGSYDGNANTADTDFVSFYRKERAGDKDGHVKGHWATSTAYYLAGHKGTPGAKERSAAVIVKPTEFSIGGLIFNEISNRKNADKAYEWIELRNKSGGEINPKKWRISIVTAVGSDVDFFTFPDNDNVKIAAGDVFLLVKSDPSGDPSHPLAAGWNVAKNAANQVNGVGAHSPRYLVANFAGDGLPDDGEFVLILRNTNDNGKLKKPENLIDIAGYSTKLKVSANETGFTNLWPLVGGVRNAELGNNKLEVDQVHRRQKDNIWGTSSTNYGRDGGNHADDTAWRGDGWTGIGYKRNAAANGINGGTPGYNHGTLKSEGIAQGSQVIISEIMFDASRNLPQWIELQNLSTATGVNIDNWSIFVVNHNLNVDGSDYEDGKLSERIDLDGRIPPGQTFLIVSTGNRSDTQLPSERIHNLRRGRGETLLNPNGFRIQLKAKTNEGDAAKHQLVDDVGNLPDKPAGSRRADAQSFMDPVWPMLSGTNEDGDRVSIARKTTKATDAQNRRTELLDLQKTGVSAWGWISSDADDRLSRMHSNTYYGHASDIASPGQTVGSILPVSLSKFRPERLDDGSIRIVWVTESETNNAGFNILRSEKRDGAFKQINTKLIAGQGTTSERTVYTHTDTSAKPNVVYYYQIQDVSLDGQVQTLRTTHLRGNVTAVGKATTTWGELKALQ